MGKGTDMADETTKQQTDEVDASIQEDSSKVFGVSLRGWIAFLIIATVCLMSGLSILIKEPLYTLCCTITAFYFGHQQGTVSRK